MSPLEAARLLLTCLTAMARFWETVCSVCFRLPHEAACPILAAPRILAALAAAERVIDDPMGAPEHADYGTCWVCDQGEPQKRLLADAGHADACPWQALVAALAGEQVTRS